ncbi:antibiotic biosynthesis monooxygenase [Devosia sediminis]|uniref:Antibiotic biosynthesis monooxygenase n=1 Tax=Devosia sediminis TaxID=2798801 RepID=A0A934J072_9HYPH|nr:antibiotic biosynthesis monooxygenase [Devosia sediminis]MBJ3785405.1 antibiotic biosynthesis monooxygenase [Devosia sediminis]
MSDQHKKRSVFRIDSFAVPAEARTAVLAQLHETQSFLDGQQGCLQNLVLEHHSGADRFNVVTVVEWESETHLASAKAAMMDKRRATGFDPERFLRSHGVEANMTNYEPLS